MVVWLENGLRYGGRLVNNTYLGFDSEAWPSDIQQADVSNSDVTELKSSLCQYIENPRDEFHVGTAIWAFGKIADKSDLPFLEKKLKEYLDSNPNTLYQVMCAIDNAGGSIFDGSGSSSMLDAEKNKALSSSYLDRV